MGMNLLDLKSDKSNSKDEGCVSIAGLGYFINGFCYVAKGWILVVDTPISRL